MEPYPLGGDKGGTSVFVLGVQNALRIFSSINIPDSEFIVSGRVRTLCKHSGVLFVTLVEEGETMQVVIERSLVGERLLRPRLPQPGYGRHHHRAGHLRGEP